MSNLAAFNLTVTFSSLSASILTVTFSSSAAVTFSSLTASILTVTSSSLATSTFTTVILLKSLWSLRSKAFLFLDWITQSRLSVAL